MELQTGKIKVTDKEVGVFTPKDSDPINWARLQHVDLVDKKVGDDYVEMTEVAYLSCSHELAAQIEKGQTYRFNIKVTIKNKDGVRSLKFTALSIVK